MEKYTKEEVEASKQCLKDVVALHSKYGAKVFSLTMGSLQKAFQVVGIKFEVIE